MEHQQTDILKRKNWNPSFVFLHIIRLLLIHPIFSSRPLVIHFTERGHYNRWDTSRAHVLPLPLRRPLHTAQGAICALLLLEGVQERGMETRQPAVAFFPTQYETRPNKGFVTPHDKPPHTHAQKQKSIPPLCIVSKSNKIWFATCSQNRWFANWVFSSQ